MSEFLESEFEFERLHIPAPSVDELIGDNVDGFRSCYERIDHPDKDKLFLRLGSVESTSWQAPTWANDSLSEIRQKYAHLGLKYFELALDTLSSDYSDTASVPLDKAIDEMFGLQLKDAFTHAYNGYTRFPGTGDTVDAMVTSLIAMKQLTNRSKEDVFQIVGQSIHGNELFVGAAYADVLLTEFVVRRNLTINGEAAGITFSPAEAGAGIFHSDRVAAGNVLEHHYLFWGNGIRHGHPLEPMPDFTANDALHLAYGSNFKKLLAFAQHFPKLDPELFRDLCRQNRGINIMPDDEAGIELVISRFGLGGVEPTSLIKSLVDNGFNNFAWEYYQRRKAQPVVPLEIFRNNITPETYEFTEAILAGTLSDEHKALGITEPGKKGVEQLRTAIKGIQQFILNPDKAPADFRLERERLLASPIYERLWRVAVRFDQATFGTTTGNELLRVLQGFGNGDGWSATFDAEPLNTEVYQPSAVIGIAERNSGYPEEFEVSQESRKIYEWFTSINSRVGTPYRPAEFRLQVTRASRELTTMAQQLDDRIVATADPKLRQKFLDERSKLEKGALFMRDEFEAADFATACKTVCDLRPVRDLLREKAIKYILESPSREAFKLAYRRFTTAGEELTCLSECLDAIDHLLVQETLLPLLPGDKQYAWDLQNSLFNTSALRTDLAKYDRLEGSPSQNLRNFSFVPSRDVGLELSGQIGDACWASRYESIAETMPHMTAVLVAEEESDSRSLVGSGLLIEATSEDGRELLIVRGLNPIQNTINQLDAGDFLEKFLDYARETAQRAGRTLALAFDDHCGGAATNRPLLYSAMQRKIMSDPLSRKGSVAVDPNQVRFNNYDLRGSIFVVA